jgi:hypothetical protein
VLHVGFRLQATPSASSQHVVLSRVENKVQLTPSINDHPEGLPCSPSSNCAYGYLRRRPKTNMGSPQFPNQLFQHSDPLTPEDSSALHFQVLHAFRGLHPISPGSAPSCSIIEGLFYDAAGFTLCYGLKDCDDIASTLGLLLTLDGRYRAPDLYPDWTFTSKLT